MFNISAPWIVMGALVLLFLASCWTVGPIRTSDTIKDFLEVIAFGSGWCLVILMFVTCMDITFRKLQLPIALTQFQELEWHLHTVIFSTWMGYNYTINAHPRVDSYTETLGFRTKAWIEFIGIMVLALPFLYVMLEHAWPFLLQSYTQNEASENVTGLPFRWAIKAVFYIGIWLVFLGVLSVLLRLIAYLFLGRSQDDSGIQIGHSEMEA